MSALRQGALQIVNEVPDELIQVLVNNLRVFKKKYVDNVNYDNIRAKAAAFAALEEWRKRNATHLPPNTDWKKEFMEAVKEKYEPFN